MSHRRWWMAGAALFGVAVLVLAWWPTRGKIAAGSNDFLSFYAGARLAGTPDLYSAERAREVQTRASGMTGEALRFIRLPYFAAVLWPLGRLPYPAAYAIFQALSLAALVAFVLVWPGDRATAALACCWSVPVSMGLASGQDITFVLLWIALALRFHRARPFVAGAILALCAAKFHLFLPLPLVLVVRPSGRIAQGFLSAGAVLLAVSFAMGGAGWPARFLAAVSTPHIGPGEKAMPNLNGWLTGVPHALVWETALALCVAALVWMAARRGGFELGLAAALAGGILTSHHAYPTDCALLIPAVLIVLERTLSRWIKLLAILLLLPPWYFFVLAQWPAGRLLVPALLTFVFAIGCGPQCETQHAD